MPGPNLVDAFRSGDPAQAFATFYETMEVRTTFSPPVVVSVQEALRTTDSGKGNRELISNLLKPTVILRGNAGTVVIAPSGPADAAGGWRMAGALLALMGVGFALGRWSK